VSCINGHAKAGCCLGRSENALSLVKLIITVTRRERECHSPDDILMAEINKDVTASAFFGIEDNDILSLLPAARVAIAKDNARLFVGNIIHNHLESSRQDVFSIDSISMNTTAYTDLLSVTDKTISLVTRIAESLRSCQRQAARLRIADLAIAGLHTECSAIRVAFHRIRKILTETNDEEIHDRFDAYILEEYENITQVSNILFRLIGTNLRKFDINDGKASDRDLFKTSLQKLWRNEQMEMASQQIGRLSRGIDILCSAFQSYDHEIL
jgi:hypothetical protein